MLPRDFSVLITCVAIWEEAERKTNEAEQARLNRRDMMVNPAILHENVTSTHVVVFSPTFRF